MWNTLAYSMGPLVLFWESNSQQAHGRHSVTIYQDVAKRNKQFSDGKGNSFVIGAECKSTIDQ